MTWRALFGSIAGQLSKAGCEDPAFDARCLLEDVGGVPRGRLEAYFGREVPETSAVAVRRAAMSARPAGRCSIFSAAGTFSI